jgi:hypothetical protein
VIGERVGDERARARAAPRPDRDPLRLRPLDEVGDDQEVAGEAHALDHLELELEPLAVGLRGCGRRDDREARGEALAGLAPEFLHLVLGELRQDRLAPARADRAAPGDLDRHLDGFGQVGEERVHRRTRLEEVLRRQAPPRRLLVEVGAVGDAEQRVARLEEVGRGEVHVVRRHQRQIEVVGEADEAGLARGLGLGAGRARFGVALHLDIEPSGESLREVARQIGRPLGLPLAKEPSERSVRAAGEADQAIGAAGQSGEREVRQGVAAVEVVRRGERHQVPVAGLALRQQHHRARRGCPIAGSDGSRVGEVELAADDRLDAGLGGGLGEFERGEEVAAVGHRDRRHAMLAAEARQLLDADGALEEGVGGVKAEVDEGRGARCNAHGRDTRRRPRTGKLPFRVAAPGPCMCGLNRA